MLIELDYFKTSGAIVAGVPQYDVKTLPYCSYLANPKSAIFKLFS